MSQTIYFRKPNSYPWASWLEELCEDVYPWANEPPFETHWGVLGGYMERAEALFVAARLHEKQIALLPLPVEHDFSIAAHLGISRGHYG